LSRVDGVKGGKGLILAAKLLTVWFSGLIMILKFNEISSVLGRIPSLFLIIGIVMTEIYWLFLRRYGRLWD